VEAGRQILDALARDRFGIGVSTLNHANPLVKPVALAADDGGPWLEARRETVFTRRYPLTRAVSAWVNRVSGQPLAPGVQEFLRYILSYEGQHDVVRDSGLLPLCAEVAREQLGVEGDRYFYGVPVPAFKKEELPR
jgi:phosphate transport system substrate-binding protein